MNNKTIFDIKPESKLTLFSSFSFQALSSPSPLKGTSLRFGKAWHVRLAVTHSDTFKSVSVQ